MVFASSLEAACGMRTTILVYVAGGACGALFGDVTMCCNSTVVYCEATSGLYALVGAYISVYIYI
jgi:hypothetical protein